MNVIPNELKFSSWSEFSRYLVNGRHRGWLFRGIPVDDYPTSRLERTLSRYNIAHAEWLAREQKALEFFKERARLYLRDLPRENDVVGWWALMQHYGAPTRLMDWTMSPFVASYFAYSQMSDISDGSVGSLWALNSEQVIVPFGVPRLGPRDHIGSEREETYADGKLVDVRYPGRTLSLEDDENAQNDLVRMAIEKSINFPLPLQIFRPDKRMTTQRACFVTSGSLAGPGNPGCIELLMRAHRDWSPVQEELNKISKGSRWTIPGNCVWSPGKSPLLSYQISGAALRKFALPAAWRSEALAALAELNITGDTLFPGLDGLGRTTDIYLQVGAPQLMSDYLLQ